MCSPKLSLLHSNFKSQENDTQRINEAEAFLLLCNRNTLNSLSISTIRYYLIISHMASHFPCFGLHLFA